MRYRILLALLALTLLVPGCKRIDQVVANDPSALPNAEVAQPGATSNDQPLEVTATSETGADVVSTADQPTSTHIPSPTYVPVELSLGSLWIKITAPPDNGIVSTPEVEVIGQATEGTVLTINDDILLVDQTQAFRSNVVLETGPNIIEVVASNENGDELYYFLTVYFEPKMTPEGTP